MDPNFEIPEKWLEKELLEMRDVVPFLDQSMVEGLVSYCPRANDKDVSEYLMNIVGQSDRASSVVSEYLLRRSSQTAGQREASKILTAGTYAAEDGFQAYVKPRIHGDFSLVPNTSSNSAKLSKTANQLVNQGSGAPVNRDLPGGSRGALSRAGRKGKKGKGVDLGEIEKGTVLFSRRSPCECQAVKHRLVNNCLSCGKIVCEQEGEGPCGFCGALVLREGSVYGGQEEAMEEERRLARGRGEEGAGGLSEAEKKAVAFKDRLVEYDRSAAKRTAVIDDQSDYFEIDSNRWLSPEEKAGIEKRQAAERLAEEERKKRVTVTFDLLGRKVLMEKNGEGSSDQDLGILCAEDLLSSDSLRSLKLEPGARVKPNPNLTTSPPVFVKTPLIVTSGSATSAVKKSAKQNESLKESKKYEKGKPERVNRIQHDDPLVEALLSGTIDFVPEDGNTTEKKTLANASREELSV